MSRSGYSDDGGDDLNLYRCTVYRCMKGKRGKAFLIELAAAMDAMPEKILIANELKDEEGSFCALGVVGAARGLDLAAIDYEEARSVGPAFGIAWQMAAEIEYMNDEYGHHDETPEDRWTRMRKWIQRQIENPGYV